MISVKDGVVFLQLYVQPGGKRSEVMGLYDGPTGQCLKIRVQAPPVEGKANEEVLRFIVELMELPKRSVSLAKGSQSRMKTLEIVSVPQEVVEKQLSKVLNSISKNKNSNSLS